MTLQILDFGSLSILRGMANSVHLHLNRKVLIGRRSNKSKSHILQHKQLWLCSFAKQGHCLLLALGDNGDSHLPQSWYVLVL